VNARITSFACIVATTAVALGLAASAAAGPSTSAPARLVGLYEAHFTSQDEQTGGTWHLRVGPGHHLKLWNTADPIDNDPSFDAGPVSFRGNRIVFSAVTAQTICTVGATYAWTLSGDTLQFRVVGTDGCEPRRITFTPHLWRRAPAFVPFVTDFPRGSR
jgi:hypothetical protein